MPRQDLIARSGIEHVFRPGHYGTAATPPGLKLALKTNVALVSVIARRDSFDNLAHRVRIAFDVELPTLPKRTGAGSISCAWAGFGQWLFINERTDPSSFEATAREQLGGFAAVSNQSDGRIVISAAGPRLPAVLAKGMSIDLHPRSFKSGDVAMTSLGHTAVHLSLLDSPSTCELMVFRSYAPSLWEWLLDAGAEFGVEVVDGPQGGARSDTRC